MARFLPMPGNEALAARLAETLGGRMGTMDARRFPDGESYVRILSPVAGEEVFLVCTLARPDPQLLPLLFAAATIRSLGAQTVRLISPYLPYMRQDAVFQPGEALTSQLFAGLIAEAFDGLVTVDPHLHRYASLGALYRIPASPVHATPLLGSWIRDKLDHVVVIGPDSESGQWVEKIAEVAEAPWALFEKARHDDHDVTVAAPNLEAWRGRQPVLVDDIISSGTTMVAAAASLMEAGFVRPYCLAVHALFDPQSGARLAAASKAVLTTDTVAHPSNAFEVAPLIAAAVAEMIAED